MVRLHLITILTLVVANSGLCADQDRGVIPVVLTAELAYTWTLNNPPKVEQSLTTSSLLTRAPLGTKGDVVYQPVEFFLITQGHHYPLRWTADANGLWVVSFFIDQTPSEFVPGRCIANRIPARLVVGANPAPKLDTIQDEGLVFDGGELIISSSGDRPTATRIDRGFLAAYMTDPKPDGLMGIAPVGKPPKDGTPTFTFDFMPPSGSNKDWTLYVQRTPRKTIEIITFRTDKEGAKIKPKIESVAVPFTEPFFAHRDSNGRIFFVTERTGRVFVANPPASGQKEWKVTVVWENATQPVVALVRDSRDGTAYACISKNGLTGQGEDQLLPLDEKSRLVSIDLKKVSTPNVNRRETAAMWFGRAVGSGLAKTPK